MSAPNAVPDLDPTLDLTITRVIRAPREAIWKAWTQPELLARWWTPAPTVARVARLDAQPGGAFVTELSEDGIEYVPHTDATYLLVEENRRLVFTNAVTSRWRPAPPAPVSMTAEIRLDDHPDGTYYRAIVRHSSPADRARHEELGFFDGWGSVTEALATLVESEVRA